MRETQDPTITIESGPMKGERITHPSFAQIAVSRRQGHAALYDSEFTHQNTVSVTIRGSHLIRSLSRNWHMAQDDLIEVEMSESQWATFVSSSNSGSGVPCTLRRDHGKPVPGLNQPIYDREKFKIEFDEKMKDAFARLESLENMLNEAKLSNKARDEIAKQIDSVRCSFTSSMPFIADQFNEHMESTVERAKTEINAFTTQALIDAGRQNLNNGLVSLDGPDNAA